MKTEKLIGAGLTIGLTIFLVVLGSKAGSAAGKKAAEEKKGAGASQYQSTVKQNVEKPFLGKLLSRQEDKGKQTILIGNMRQIGMAMFEFQVEFGEFPNFQLNKFIKEKGDHPELLDPDYLFSQLLASDMTQAKNIFKTPPDSSGEWLYFGHGLNPKSKSTEVLLMSPLVGGKVGILRIDNSVKLVLPEDANKMTVEINSVPIRIPQRH